MINVTLFIALREYKGMELMIPFPWCLFKAKKDLLELTNQHLTPLVVAYICPREDHHVKTQSDYSSGQVTCPLW